MRIAGRGDAPGDGVLRSPPRVVPLGLAGRPSLRHRRWPSERSRRRSHAALPIAARCTTRAIDARPVATHVPPGLGASAMVPRRAPRRSPRVGAAGRRVSPPTPRDRECEHRARHAELRVRFDPRARREPHRSAHRRTLGQSPGPRWPRLRGRAPESCALRLPADTRSAGERDGHVPCAVQETFQLGSRVTTPPVSYRRPVITSMRMWVCTWS